MKRAGLISCVATLILTAGGVLMACKESKKQPKLSPEAKLLRRCEHDRREQACEAYLKKHPKSVRALVGLAKARCLFVQCDVLVEPIWRRVLKLKSDHVEALSWLGKSLVTRAHLSKKRRLALVNEAEPLLKRALALQESPFTREALITVYLFQYQAGRRNPKAVPFIIKSIDRYESSRYLHGQWLESLSKVLEILGQLHAAEKALCKAVVRYVFVAATKCLQLRIKVRKLPAIEAYKPGKDWSGHYVLALHWLQKGQSTRARDHLKKAAALNDVHPGIWKWLADLNYKQGNKRQACEAAYRQHQILLEEKPGAAQQAATRGSYRVLAKLWGCKQSL